MKAKVLDTINPTKAALRDCEYTMEGLDAVLKIGNRQLFMKSDVQPIYVDYGMMEKNVPTFIVTGDNFLCQKLDLSAVKAGKEWPVDKDALGAIEKAIEKIERGQKDPFYQENINALRAEVAKLNNGMPIICALEKNAFDVRGIISKEDASKLHNGGVYRATLDHFTKGPGFLEGLMQSSGLMVIVIIALIGLLIGNHFGWIKI